MKRITDEKDMYHDLQSEGKGRKGMEATTTHNYYQSLLYEKK